MIVHEEWFLNILLHEKGLKALPLILDKKFFLVPDVVFAVTLVCVVAFFTVVLVASLLELLH